MRTLFTPLLVTLLAVGASAQSWSDAAPMETARVGAASAILDGRLYVMGGRDAAGEPLRSVEVFDPATGWSRIGDLLSPRVDAAAAVLDSVIVLVGGRSGENGPIREAEVFDPAWGRWRPFAGLQVEREGLAVVAQDSVLFVIGGTGPNGSYLAATEAYGLGSGWAPFSAWDLSPASERARFGAAVVDDALIVIGGLSQFGPLRSVERYAPGEPPHLLFPLPEPGRGGFATALKRDTIYVVGGLDGNGRVLTDVHELTEISETPLSGVWTALSPLPSPREGAVAAVLGDSLYVVGGADEFGSVLASVVRFPLVEEVVETPVAAGEAPGADRPTLAVVGPNPSRRGTTFEVRAEEPGPARLAVVDALGREVAILLDRAVGREAVRLRWDADVPAGVYVARLSGPGGVATTAVTVVR